jgi:glycosyltransferase involved in cell wall biosynthesis
MNQKLHIGLVAIACNPYHVSEAGLGWKSVLALAGSHRLTVFTHTNNQADLEKFLSSPSVDARIRDVNFVFVAKQHGYLRNEAIARMLNWHYYRLWLGECVEAVSRCSASDPINLVHHITYSTWRMGSPFYQTGLPTVWGPVGGAGKVPFSAYGVLSTTTRCTEALRGILSFFYRLTPAFRRSLAANTVILASNEETRKFLNRHTRREIGIVFPTYFDASEASLPPAKALGGPIRCFYGGGVIGSKGISLSLRAIAKARGQGADLIFKIAGQGPEREHLIELARTLGIADHVHFLPLLSGQDYQAVLQEADLFLFPSFRENIGITMVDAMLHHTAPIVLDTSAPGEIVTEECGWKIPVTDNETIVENISAAILQAHADRDLLDRKRRAARERILTNYSQERYLAQLKIAYEHAAIGHRHTS